MDWIVWLVVIIVVVAVVWWLLNRNKGRASGADAASGVDADIRTSPRPFGRFDDGRHFGRFDDGRHFGRYCRFGGGGRFRGGHGRARGNESA